MAPVMRSARPGLAFKSQRRGVTPLVLLVNFSGDSLREVWYQRRFNQLGVQGGDAVDRVAADNRQICHADFWVRALLNHGHPYLPPAVIGPLLTDFG